MRVRILAAHPTSAINRLKCRLAMAAASFLLLAGFGGPALADEDKEDSHAEESHLTVKGAATYEAPLPAQLNTDPNLCAWVPCDEVMPHADNFSPRKGRPTYVEAYHEEHGQQD